MPSLSEWFENLIFAGADQQSLNANKKPVVVTVIGSGGKTSLIWHLASALSKPLALAKSLSMPEGENELSGRRILVTPTTKMTVPPEDAKFYDRYYDFSNDKNSIMLPEPAPGITLTGIYNKTRNKLESLPLKDLEKNIPGYDLVLLEGDGSREHPLKAWNDEEPVVPDFTDLTIGVMPLWPLGKPVSREIIHRLYIFLSLTGTVPGETLKMQHILWLLTGREGLDLEPPVPGLFSRARGKKLLFFNQIENEASLKQAGEMAGLMPSWLRDSLSWIIAGSVKTNSVVLLSGRNVV